MTETIVYMDVVEKDKICEKCFEGNMRPLDLVYTVNPPKYPHVCNKCGFKAVYLKRYPSIEYIKRKEIL